MKELKGIVVRKIENQNVKWYATLTHKPNNLNILTEPHFTLDVCTPFNTDNTDAMYSAVYITLLKKFSTYQSNGSRWVAYHFIDISLDKLDDYFYADILECHTFYLIVLL